MATTPSRPPMPIPGSMGLPAGTIRWIAFQWMGEGWSVIDVCESLRDLGHVWGFRCVRRAARAVIRDGGHAFVWAVYDRTTVEVAI